MKKIFTFLLSLGCTAAMAQNINGDFDTWRTFNAGIPSTTLTAPNGWFGTDSLLFTFGPFLSPGTTFKPQLTKATPSHTGAFAAQIMSHDQGTDFGILPGLLINGNPTIDVANFDPNDPFGSMTFEGGLQTIERVNTLSAWVKYAPRDTDMGQIAVLAFLEGAAADGTDSLIGYADTTLDQAYPAYTEFNLRVEYMDATVIPNKVLIGFISSADEAIDSSVMQVDDAEVMSASGVKIPVFQQQIVKVYPTPATDVLNLNTTYSKELTWQAFSIDGKVVKTVIVNGNTSVNISDLAAGSYLYRVSDMNGKVLQQNKFIKQ
ncbi:MAG: T9SS type A sorting domain-containing protein [Sphingobacteriales bacterium]|nr:MAG: T9SS type A sorting domain-containing protein [Sphingobacteriales bacterium]